ncbi:MAG: outer membrane lipoprotein-sorting protein [Candidatus Cloacimonetes bacterium]|nr:outer membrane lipoprotein-sorting protein [Candidatus Cloacimonadota bacterium]
MKKIILTLTMMTGLLFAEELSVDEIVKKIDKAEQVESSFSKGKQIIITSSGKKRTLEMESYSKDKNDKQLMIYTAPVRVKGDKILMLNDGDDIWFYTPKTDRVRHLASHAKKKKVQGSDFSYEDMSGGNIKEDYNYELLRIEEIADRECYKLELSPKPSGPHYSKLILWADTERFITLRIDYFEDDELLKRLTMSDIQKINDRWVALKMVMKNLLEGGETVMEMTEMQFDIEIEDNVFTTNNLKKH